MAHTPKVFVSATTGDLRSIRQLVKEALLTTECHPVEQTTFGPDARTVEAMLRGKIGECQALIHIAGLRYGAEPSPPADPRRSYTQLEYHLGRQLQEERGPDRFRVYTFICPEDFPYDPEPDVEGEELRALQREHRLRLLDDPHLRERPRTPQDIDLRVRALQEQVHLIRHEQEQVRQEVVQTRRWGVKALAVVLAVVAVCAGLVVWKQTRTERGIEEVKTIVADPAVLRAKLEEKIDETFERKKGELLRAKAPPAEIDALFRWRDRAKGQVAEGVAFITARAADPKSPIIARAAAILEERGVDAALEFLDATLKAERQRRKDEGRQLAEASMMKAGLHESRLEAAEQEHAVRDAIADAPDWWQPHSDLGLILHRRAQWEVAEQEFEAARKSMGADGEATVLNNLATLYQATNRLAEAEPLLERALKIDEKSFGPEHPNVAIRLGNLATLYYSTNRMADAEPLMKRVTSIFEKSHGLEHPNVAVSLNNLAQLYQDTNRLAEAEPLIERALKIAEKSFGPEHPDVAIDLNNLAQLYKDTNRLAEAEPLMERALKIDEKSFGPEHPNVAIRLNNLAQLYKDTNRLAEAEPLMERVLKIDEKSFGPEHPNVARDLNNLASLYQDTNRLAEAEPLMKRALKIDEKSYEPEHPNVAIRLNNLASLYRATNRLAEAEPLLRRAVTIFVKFTRKTGHQHPNLRAAIGNYRDLLGAMALADGEVAERLAAAGREAGYTDAEFDALLAPMFGPFDVTVTEVVATGQGPELGIRVGDIVRSYHGQEITGAAGLIKLVGEAQGEAIPLEIQRGGETLKLMARPGKLGLRLEDRPRKPAR